MTTVPNRSLNLLYPPFRERVLQGLKIAHEQGLMAYVFEAWRSRERQAFLYAQGRATPGPIVTNARAGLSFHQYGIAVDLVFDKDPIMPSPQWTWAGDYEALTAIMKSQGLENLKMEKAHFQMSFGMTIAEVQRIAEARGILGLWDEFDKRLSANPTT